MTSPQSLGYIGMVLCIIGALITLVNTVSDAANRIAFVTGIGLIITGIILMEIVMHTPQS